MSPSLPPGCAGGATERGAELRTAGLGVVKSAAMKATIVVLPGDGIGPEVTAEGVRVLRAVASKLGHTFDLREHSIGGGAIDRLGTPLPAETTAACKAADAILLGAVGGPKWDDPDAPVRPEQGLFAIRRELGLFANLRPVTTHPKLVAASTLRPEVVKGVDLLVVRELTGGLYFGEKKRTADKASDLCEYSVEEVRRVVRRAASFARLRRKKLTSVDKANALETSRLWRRVAEETVRKEYPDVTLEHVLVDACAMYLIRKPAAFDVIVTENLFGDILTDEASMLAGSMGLLPSASLGEGTRGLYEPIHGSAPDIALEHILVDACAMYLIRKPASFDVIVTENLFGDILTDEASMLAGSMGLLPSASLGEGKRGLYEPIHGSAPDIAGKGIANPYATILSTAMLLRHSLGLEVEAKAVEQAVDRAIDGGVLPIDIAGPGRPGASTVAAGQAVVAAL